MSSSPSAIRRIVLIAGETMWISLCLSAIANTWPHFSMSVPYWALLLPGLLGIGIGMTAIKIGISWQSRIGLAFLPSILLMALCAGLLADASIGGSIVRTAFTPWRAPSGHASSITTLAWLDVAMVVVRAIQVAMTKDSFVRTVRSVIVASIAYFALFLAAATQHSAQLTHATRFIEPIFLVYFVLALASLRLSRATDIEHSTDIERSTTGDLRWRTLLAIPLLGVVIIGVIVSELLGSSGGVLHRILLDTAHAIGWFFTKVGEGIAFVIVHIATGIAYAIGFLINLIVHQRVEAPWTKVTKSKVSHVTTTTHGHPPIGLTAGLIVVFCVALAIGIWYLLRNRTHETVRVNKVEDERRDSTFTWGNLFRQILAGLHHLVTALISSIWRRKIPQQISLRTPDAPPGLRRDYQKFLIAARKRGFGRLAHETALEYSSRLQTALDLQGQEALGHITVAYERLRYGDVDDVESSVFHDDIANILNQMMNQETVPPPASA